MHIASYVATRPGFQGLFNRIVRLVLWAPESHSELVFSDGMSFSCSFLDRGPRFKRIEFNPEHWAITKVPDNYDEQTARALAEQICSAKTEVRVRYSLMLLAAQVLPMLLKFVRPRDEICSTVIARVLGLSSHKRYEPHELRAFFSSTR